MTFIEEYFEYIVFFILLGIIVLEFIIISYNHFFSKHFSNKKFHIQSGYEIEPMTKTKRFSITIFNNNINDTRITGFGFMYKNQNIDYYKTYLKEKELPNDAKIIIPSRDCIGSDVDVNNLKVIIYDINRGKYRVRDLKVFVTDSLGLTTQARAKSIKKHLFLLLKADNTEERKRMKEAKAQSNKEHQDERMKIRIDRRMKFKEKWDKFLLSVRSKFKRH